MVCTVPSFLRYIGDKGVRNIDDAVRYLRNWSAREL